MKELLEIVELLVASVNKRLEERSIKLKLTEEAKKELVKLGYDPAYGARPLKRVVQRYLETPLAEKIIKGEIKDNTTLVVDYDGKSFSFVSS
jgi:ATP-dependent Clp protease ATP-binding subunit ClpB